MQILLLSLYELGHQPTSIARPATFLRRAGFDVALQDLSVEALDPSKAQKAQAIFLSVPMHTALRLGYDVAHQLRKLNPSCHLGFFGLYAWLNAFYLLNEIADSVLAGEIEEPLGKLVQALAGRLSIDNLEGVSTKDHIKKPNLKRPPSLISDRLNLPSLDRYAKLVGFGDSPRLVGYVEATHGCKHFCRHCPVVPVYQGRFFAMDFEVVCEEIREQVSLGAEHITFGDPDFLNGPGHALKITGWLHRNYPRLTFDFTTKVEHLVNQADILGELKKLGALFVISAFESISDEVLRQLDKGHTFSDIIKVLQILAGVGLTVRPTFIPFTPWSTRDDYLGLLNFVAENDLVWDIDPVQYTLRLLIPPGSFILETLKGSSILGPIRPNEFQYEWHHADSQMDEWWVDVSSFVEDKITVGLKPPQIFWALYERACQWSGKPPMHFPGSFAVSKEVPRLTESWFCCAEPTKKQKNTNALR